MDHLDDDENVKMMRETAATIGLTALLVQASQSTDSATTQALIRQALRLLGKEN
jgi:hypothetical protein